MPDVLTVNERPVRAYLNGPLPYNLISASFATGLSLSTSEPLSVNVCCTTRRGPFSTSENGSVDLSNPVMNGLVNDLWVDSLQRANVTLVLH